MDKNLTPGVETSVIYIYIYLKAQLDHNILKTTHDDKWLRPFSLKQLPIQKKNNCTIL